MKNEDPGGRELHPDPGRVEVLRIGHRPARDKRITTHVSLVARAFGARVVHVDTEDKKLKETVDRVTRQFGGDFRIRTGQGINKVLRNWKGVIVHLTMYGVPVDEAVLKLPEGDDILVVVGAGKVSKEVYDLAHFNVSITNQPHSEVSSLAIFLDRLFGGNELPGRFPGSKITIIPDPRGKNVVEGERDDPGSVHGKKEWNPIPDTEEAIEILRYAGCSRPVELHGKEVYRLGMDMIERSKKAGCSNLDKIDLRILKPGLILHDLGRARTHSVKHITEGVKLAKDMGLDPRIVSIIHDHIGAGVTKDEAENLGLPPEDHIPKTWEEKIVCHSDSLTSGSRRKTLEEAKRQLLSKGAESAAERMEVLHRDLEGFLCIDIDELLH